VARASGHRASLEAWLDATRDAATSADLHKLCGLIERDTGDNDAALRHFLAGADAAARAGDAIAQAQLANEIGVVHWRRGNLELARKAFAESLAINESNGDVFDTPTSLHNVAYCDLELGRFDDADEALGRALQMVRERANLRGEALVLSSLGILARKRGDFVRAEALSRACLALAERMGYAGAVADAIDDLAQVLETRGDFAQAEPLYQRALAMARQLGQVYLQCMVLLHFARMQAAAGGVVKSADSLREALRLAEGHDFHAGRLMGMLGAAGLRLAADDPDAKDAAVRWRDTVLAIAGANVDVKDALPPGLRAAEGKSALAAVGDPEAALNSVSAEVVAFLDRLATAD